MLDIENLTITKVRFLDILLPSQLHTDCQSPHLTHLGTLRHFRCEISLSLANIIGIQTRLVSLHLPQHTVQDVKGYINTMLLTSLTLGSMLGLEHDSVPLLLDLTTRRSREVDTSIVLQLTSLTLWSGHHWFKAVWNGADQKNVRAPHQLTELGALKMTMSYLSLQDLCFDKLAFDSFIWLAKLRSLSLRVFVSSGFRVGESQVDILVAVLHELMLEHPTLEHLHICCQPFRDDIIGVLHQAFKQRLIKLSLANRTKVKLVVCSDTHIFTEYRAVSHHQDCFR